MNMIEWIRFILGVICIVAGLVFYVIQFIGVFRFRNVLNRIHAAAIGDTLAFDLVLLGTIFLNGINFGTLKIVFVILFMWFTAPVATHMIAKLEVFSREHMEDCCPVENAKDLEEDA